MAQRFCSTTELGILRIGRAEEIKILVLLLKKCLQLALPSPQHCQGEHLHQLPIMQDLLIQGLILLDRQEVDLHYSWISGHYIFPSMLGIYISGECINLSTQVLIVALVGILPMAPRQLQYKGYRLSLLGTTCTTGYALFAFYGLPRAGNMLAVQAWGHHVTSSKDFIPFMYCLMFVTSKLHLKLVLVPVICWALEHVARFLRRHFTNSSLYRTYLEQPCTWVETNTSAVNFLSSNAEILLGFLLILSLFSRQRNAMQTFMYWQFLKLMYHSPFTAGYHRAIWLKIGRTVNPYIHRYTPFLHDPINAGMRWWFR